MESIKLTSKDVPKEYRVAGYTGRKFRLVITHSVEIPMDAGLWSGGSREMYYFIDLANGRTVEWPYAHTGPWNPHRQAKEYMLPDNIACVRHTHFCGTDLGLTFHVNPNNAGKFLPAKG
jgi:hypothetical protein